MPITGRTPHACFDRFRDHISPLVAEIVPTESPLLCLGRSDDKMRRVLSFRNSQRNDAAEIDTSAGSVFFHVTQHLIVVHRDEDEADVGEEPYRLRTLAYRYALYSDSPGPLDEPVFRWEYDSQSTLYNKHHLQFGRTVEGRAPHVQLSGHALDLNRIHIPTGWVLLEEVLRFMIHELDMKPPCGDAWDAKLRQSEKAFFERFTSKRHTPLPSSR